MPSEEENIHADHDGCHRYDVERVYCRPSRSVTVAHCSGSSTAPGNVRVETTNVAGGRRGRFRAVRGVDLCDTLREVLRVSTGSNRATGKARQSFSIPRTRAAQARRRLLAAVFTTLCLVLAGCGGSQPRTELLRSSDLRTLDIYVRITGPGGAVSYTAQRFMTSSGFSRYGLRKDPRGGFFVPPNILERKLCASTHAIGPGDAPQLRKWLGKKLEITIYGAKTADLFCAALGPGLYQSGS